LVGKYEKESHGIPGLILEDNTKVGTVPYKWYEIGVN
jgi:hypothetical protein